MNATLRAAAVAHLTEVSDRAARAEDADAARQAVVMARAAGLTVAEIARTMGVSRQWLYARWPDEVALVPELLEGLDVSGPGHYLAAVGFAAAVGSRWPDAVTWWDGTALGVAVPVPWDTVLDWISDEWAPSPVVSPWNADTGLRPSGLEQRALDWVDAAAALNVDGTVAYPVLCGTGGTWRRREISTTRLMALDQLGDIRPTLVGAAEPVAIECPWFLAGASWWRFVLAVHGAAQLSSRRLTVAGGHAWQTTPVVTEDDAIADWWAPLWHTPAPWREVRRMLTDPLVPAGGQEMLLALASGRLDVAAAARWTVCADGARVHRWVPQGVISILRRGT